LVDEFKGDPNRVNRVLAERPYPLQLGGEPVLGGAESAPKKAVDDAKAVKPKKRAEGESEPAEEAEETAAAQGTEVEAAGVDDASDETAGSAGSEASETSEETVNN